MRLMNSPKSVDVEITSRCNLRCTYCSHFESAGDVGTDLPKEEWLQFIDELGRNAVMEVTLSGGEPFIRNDLREILDGIVRNRMRFSLLSNGTLITDEMAAYLASTRRCNSVQVSIDGSIPTTHDACRGEGNFVRALDGIAALRRHKVPVAIRVTIHRQNLHDLENIARFLLEEKRLPSFSCNSACHLGLCRKNAEVVEITPAERSFAMKELLRLNRKYSGRITATAGPLAEATMFWEMERARKEGKAAIPGRGSLCGCGGAMSKLAVRADGTMVPCCQVPMIELGRINRDSMKEVWQHHPELDRFRRRNEIPLSSFEFCQDCPYIPFCTGSCPATAVTLIGNPYHPSPDSCLRLFLKDGGRLPDEELLPQGGAPACG
jgi:SynChlorMet cassette radical SAM/SPASM protein ScmE